MLFYSQIIIVFSCTAGLSKALTTLARCNADNCYRALFPCPTPSAVSSASAFCASITADGTTAADFPTRATMACGTLPARYVSACACGPTCSAPPSSLPTPTPCVPYGGLLTNGDFECGLAPWTVEVPDINARAGITSSSPSSGQKAFESRLLGDRPLQQPPVSARLIGPSVSVQRNVPCKLTFAVWFDNPDAGFVGVQVNGQAGTTVDARDGAGWGVWKTVSLDYTPVSGSVQITFELVYARTVSIVRLDGVGFNYIR